MPTAVDIICAIIITIAAGNFTGEIISRPINAYVQAICMLVTVMFGIIALRMITVWIYEYVTNKNK